MSASTTRPGPVIVAVCVRCQEAIYQGEPTNRTGLGLEHERHRMARKSQERQR